MRNALLLCMSMVTTACAGMDVLRVPAAMAEDMSCNAALAELDDHLEQRRISEAEDALSWVAHVCRAGPRHVEAARARVDAVKAHCAAWRSHYRELILRGQWEDARTALDGVRKACPDKEAAEDARDYGKRVVDVRALAGGAR